MNESTKTTRRQFLKGAGAATLAVVGVCKLPQSVFADGSSTETCVDPVSILIDVSRCQGCDSCALACKEANQLPLTDNPPSKLDADTYTFVDRREVTLENGEVETRYVKRGCMHCLNAACVSACPAAAMYKTDEGPVYYRANRCWAVAIARWAAPLACPSSIGTMVSRPKSANAGCATIVCRKENNLPVSNHAPPALFVSELRSRLLAEAHARIDSNPDHYVDHVYGEHEVGGTSVLYISDVPFEQLGLPTNLPTTAPPEETEKIMSKLPFVIGGLAVALTGTAAYTHRHEHETEITEE